MNNRVIKEHGHPARLAAILEPLVEAKGYRLVRVRITATGGCTLQIMVERPDGTLQIEDCEALSRLISPTLDAHDPFESPYRLEVSSPGIDRPLVRPSDFTKWRTHEVKVELHGLNAEGRKRYRGFLDAATEQDMAVREVQGKGKDDRLFTIPYDHIAEARLVLTERLLKEAENAAKERQKQRQEMQEMDEEKSSHQSIKGD